MTCASRIPTGAEALAPVVAVARHDGVRIEVLREDRRPDGPVRLHDRAQLGEAETVLVDRGHGAVRQEIEVRGVSADDVAHGVEDRPERARHRGRELLVARAGGTHRSAGGSPTRGDRTHRRTSVCSWAHPTIAARTNPTGLRRDRWLHEEVTSSQMERDDPAWKGQRDYTPRLLGAYDRIVLGFVAKAVWQLSDAPARGRLSPAHPAAPPGRRAGHRLLHRALGPRRRQPGHDPRPQPERPRACRAAPAAVRRDRRPGRRPQTAGGRGPVRLRRPAPGDPLPARADGAQGAGGAERGRGPRARRRAVRRVGARAKRAPLVARAPGADRVQPPGRLRQPRRQRGGAARDPRGVVRARGASRSSARPRSSPRRTRAVRDGASSLA